MAPTTCCRGCRRHRRFLKGRSLASCGSAAQTAELSGPPAVEEQHPGVQAMFMIGCGADANPYPRGMVEAARWHGKELAAEVCRLLPTPLRSVRGPLRAELNFVDLPLQPVPSRERLEELNKGPGYITHNTRRMLEALDRNESLPTHYRAPIALWQFGEDLTLVGLPGETVSEYVPLVEKSLGPRRLWIAGYCNEVFGYLVTAKIIEEGGYDTRGLFREIGFFSPTAQDVVIDTVGQLAERAGRKLPPEK